MTLIANAANISKFDLLSAGVAFILKLRTRVNVHGYFAVQGKKDETLSLINKRFEISRYRHRAATCPIDMPVWGALKKDATKKPPRMVKRLDGKAPSTKRTTRIRSNGEGPARKKRKTRASA